MSTKIINSREQISNIGTEDEHIHFTFRPSNTDILKAIKLNPNIKTFLIPESYMQTLSKAIIQFVEDSNIELKKGSVWDYKNNQIPIYHSNNNTSKK